MLRLRVEVFKKYINEKLSNMPVPKMELLNETVSGAVSHR